MRTALACALSVDDVDQLGRNTGQRERLRTVTSHRLVLSIISGLAGAKIESLADLVREFDHQNDVTVAYKAFYNRLARPGFAKFMHAMFTRLVDQLSIQTLQPEGHPAVSRFSDIVIQDGSSFAVKKTLRSVFPSEGSQRSNQLPSSYMPRIAVSPMRSARSSSRPTRKPSDSFFRTRRR